MLASVLTKPPSLADICEYTRVLLKRNGTTGLKAAGFQARQKTDFSTFEATAQHGACHGVAD